MRRVPSATLPSPPGYHHYEDRAAAAVMLVEICVILEDLRCSAARVRLGASVQPRYGGTEILESTQADDSRDLLLLRQARRASASPASGVLERAMSGPHQSAVPRPAPLGERSPPRGPTERRSPPQHQERTGEHERSRGKCDASEPLTVTPAGVAAFSQRNTGIAGTCLATCTTRLGLLPAFDVPAGRGHCQP